MTRTGFYLMAAAFLLTAATVVSAQDDSDDKRPRAITAAEQLADEEAKKAPSIPVETKPAEVKKAQVAEPAEKKTDYRFAEIPDQAAVVLKLNLNKLYSSPTFKAVADSGDVLAIRNDLKQIPWTKDGALPDPVILYAPCLGSSYAMLVGIDRSCSEIRDLLAAKFGKSKKVESGKTGLGEKITVTYDKVDRKTKKVTPRTEAEILFLTGNVAAFGRKGCPLDLGFFAGGKLSAEEFAKLQDLPDNVVAAGVMRSFPVAASEDPTGLATLVTSGELMVTEYAPGAVSLVLDLNCKNAKDAELAARRMKSFLRITLVSLFAADKTLFQELNKSCSTSSSGNTAKLEVKLTKNTMDRVRAFYLLEKTILSAATDVATAVVKGVAGGKK